MDRAQRLRELGELESALRALLALLAGIPREPWTWHFGPLLEATASMRSADFTQDDLTELSSRITSYFAPKDAGFGDWCANFTDRALEDAARRVDAAARALRFIGDVP